MPSCGESLEVAFSEQRRVAHLPTHRGTGFTLYTLLGHYRRSQILLAPAPPIMSTCQLCLLAGASGRPVGAVEYKPIEHGSP